jgi:hypothetical protein
LHETHACTNFTSFLATNPEIEIVADFPTIQTFNVSAKAANAIVEHNVVINWAKVDDRMLNLIMHGTPSTYLQGSVF